MTHLWTIFTDLPFVYAVLAKITLLLGVAWVFDFGLRRTNPRWRQHLWRIAFAGVLVVPALEIGAPDFVLAVETPVAPLAAAPEVSVPLPNVTLPVDQVLPDATNPSRVIGMRSEFVVSEEAPRVQVAASPPSAPSVASRLNWMVLAGALYALVASALLYRVFIGAWRVRRMVQAATSAPAELHRLADSVANALGCGARFEVRLMSGLGTPFLAGVLRPVIVLPQEMLETENTESMRGVLAHELAHLNHHDQAWLLLERILLIPLWCHPLMWRAGAAHRSACEEVCDAVASEHVGSAQAYSGTLARTALAMLRHQPAPGGVPMLRGAEITRRLRRLHLGIRALPLRKRWVTTVVLVALACVGTLGSLRLVSAGAEAVEAAAPVPGGLELALPEGVGIFGTRSGDSVTWRMNLDDGWTLFEGGKVPERHWVGLKTQALGANLDTLLALPEDAIQALALENSDVTDDDLARIAEHFIGLRAIELDRAGITDAGVEFLAKLPQLTHLGLERTGVTDAGVEALAETGRLTYIDLYRTEVTDAAVEALAACKGLKWLGLEDTGITDASLTAINGLPALEGINVGGNAISEAGIVQLAKITSLKHVHLDDVQVTEAAAVAIASLPRLEELEIETNGLSNGARAALAKSPAFAPPAEGTLLHFRFVDAETGEGLPVAVDVNPSGGERYAVLADASGNAELRVDESTYTYLDVKPSLEGYVPSQATWRKDEGDLLPESFVMEIHRGTAIGGIIKDEQGNPVANARVSLLVPGEDYGRVQPAIWDHVVSTDSDGRWSCNIMPPDLNDVWIRLAHDNFVDDTMYGVTPKPSIDALRAGTGEMVMKRGITVAGTVTDESGEPVQGAEVKQGRDRWGSHYPSTRTAQDGSFAFPQSNTGEMVLTVQKEGYAPEVQLLDVVPGIEAVPFTLTAPHTARGKLVDGEGKPVSGARVMADTWRGFRAISYSTESDAQGKFTWASAPADGVEYDILAEGFMSARNTVVVPGDEPTIVTLRRPLVLKGTVSDKETGEALPEFKVIPGVQWNSGNTYWEQRDAATGREGNYEVRFTEPRDVRLLRIEADGYVPVVSETISDPEGERILDFALARGSGLQGVVKNASGTPVAGGKVYIVTAGRNFFIENGRVENPRELVRVETDESGHFELPPQAEIYTLAAFEDAGSAVVTQAEFETTNEMVLEPWGRIEGVLKIGAEPASGQKVVLSYSTPQRPGQPQFNTHYQTDCGRDGAFVFDRVIPGNPKVLRGIEMGGMRTSYSHGIPVSVRPGETVAVTLGGVGRPVIGKIVPPEDLEGPPLWSMGTFSLSTIREEPEYPSGWESMALEARQAWYETYQKSEEYKALERTQRHYAFTANEEGSFHIDDVEAGKYQLRAQLHAPSEENASWQGDVIAQGTMDVEVPPMETLRSDDPLVLAELQLETYHAPVPMKAGEQAPSFEVAVIDGEKTTLEDFRGKYLLLDFWATWCGPCVAETPHLKAAYEKYKDHPDFAMLGLSLDQEENAPKGYAEKNELGWIQGFLGDWSKTDVPNQYGVRGIPTIVLIGPDGKIIESNLRGAQVEAAIGKALGK